MFARSPASAGTYLYGFVEFLTGMGIAECCLNKEVAGLRSKKG